MHILCISLTGKQNQGARSIQMAKVIKALQMQGAFVTVITHLNDKLEDPGPDAGRVIRINPSPKGFFPHLRGVANRISGRVHPGLDPTLRMAIEKAMEVVKNENPDCLFSSSNPVGSHLAARMVARRSGLPWLASFSDPKPSTMLPPPYGGGIKKYFPKAYAPALKKVLHDCDAVHMPTRICLDIMGDHYGVALGERGVAIPPIGETEALTPKKSYNGSLIHLGSISRRLSNEFTGALAGFCQNPPAHFSGLLFVGKHHKKTASLMQKAGLGKFVNTRPQLPHTEALEELSRASAVLILEADMAFSHALPSKFAEAAFSGTPILAITPARSAVRDYLNAFGGGIASGHSRTEILEALHRLFEPGPEGLRLLAAGQQKLAPEFGFEQVGRCYMEVFDRIVRAKLSPPH